MKDITALQNQIPANVDWLSHWPQAGLVAFHVHLGRCIACNNLEPLAIEQTGQPGEGEIVQMSGGSYIEVFLTHQRSEIGSKKRNSNDKESAQVLDCAGIFQEQSGSGICSSTCESNAASKLELFFCA